MAGNGPQWHEDLARIVSRGPQRLDPLKEREARLRNLESSARCHSTRFSMERNGGVDETRTRDLLRDRQAF